MPAFVWPRYEALATQSAIQENRSLNPFLGGPVIGDVIAGPEDAMF
ncbi:MAG: hypothetical protein WAT81_02325 [Candidatus Moraniibacteriota bacterium]